jgi:hypothetical protein
MRKVIMEILGLLWKLIRKAFWEWLKPILGRILLIAFAIVAFVAIAIVLIGR